jgi:DNA helicase II / ATP-dependent DNA helicase PcrA
VSAHGRCASCYEMSVSLNPAQQAAVEHRGSPLLVLAGAGTGKTRVITHRVAALLDEGVEPWKILAVTFTNRAAGEMRERIDHLCGGRHAVHELWVGTFHSICARILRRHGEPLGLSRRFTIYDRGDQVSLMGRVLQQLDVPDRLYTPRGVLTHIDRAKNRGLGPADLDPHMLIEPVLSVVREAYVTYQKRLLDADAVDFGDLLMHVVALLRRSSEASEPSGAQLADFDPMVRLARRFSHVVVDEFQDTNPVQGELVDRLSQCAELCVVGDDDQAIYGWRGADVDQILQFPDAHPGTQIVRLEQNYRSTTHILACADAVIRKNRGRLGKTLWSALGEGDPVRLLMLGDERDEARLVAHEIRQLVDEGASPEDFGIFYRTHAQSRVLEDEVRRMSLSARIVGGVAFYERAEVKDVLSYLTVLHNPQSEAHVLRVLNKPTRGIGATSRDRLVQRAAAQGQSLWEAMHDPSAAGLGKAASTRVRAFVTLIEDLREDMGSLQLDELLVRVLDATGYREALAADDSEESMTRLENLQELLGNLQEFLQERPDAGLEDYLELVSLVGGERAEGERDRAVTLMTVHSAKGLEFEHVYLTGMEERVFPHARVIEEERSMEEERRLAYVAFTRAKRHLTITLAAHRRLFGQSARNMPSRFVGSLPRASVITSGVAAAARPGSAGVVRRQQAPPTPIWQDDVTYDVDPDLGPEDMSDAHADEEGIALFVGMTVRHAKFGEGQVIGWTGSGNKLKLQLEFPGQGVKTILATHCQPL